MKLQGKLLQHDMNTKQMLEKYEKRTYQNVLATNIKYGQSHEIPGNKFGGCNILPTPKKHDFFHSPQICQLVLNAMTKIA